jgi:tetratricopeptide (TPR) repeat protein
LCEQICQDGLIASSGDGTLLNNLAFALANQGKLKEAQEALNRAMRSAPSGATKICCDATQGLIYFRTGETEKGRERYEAAMSGASKARLVSIQIRGALHLALEELNVDPDRALQPTRIALSLAKPSRDPELNNLLRRLHDILAKQAHRNGEIDAMLTELSELIKPSKSLPIVKTTFVPLM